MPGTLRSRYLTSGPPARVILCDRPGDGKVCDDRSACPERGMGKHLAATAVWPGDSYPLGATYDGAGTNFALFSEVADRVELCLFDEDGKESKFDLHEVDGLGRGEPVLRLEPGPAAAHPLPRDRHLRGARPRPDHGAPGHP